MKNYMILEGNSLSQDEVKRAIARAHSLRSEAAWKFFQAVSAKISKLFHSNTQDGSDLVHSA